MPHDTHQVHFAGKKMSTLGAGLIVIAKENARAACFPKPDSFPPARPAEAESTAGEGTNGTYQIKVVWRHFDPWAEISILGRIRAAFLSERANRHLEVPGRARRGTIAWSSFRNPCSGQLFGDLFLWIVLASPQQPSAATRLVRQRGFSARKTAIVACWLTILQSKCGVGLQ